ncbi:MAG: MarR family transcriptional regulator [Gemmatimonadetes bacterium]|nr:MarR family transcriptional regulator [Gemmatimonadota bacterium]
MPRRHGPAAPDGATREGRAAPAPATAAHALPAGREAWELLSRFFPGIRADLLAAWAEFELTPAQGRVLQYLDPEHPVPMAELADTHCCDASNITGLVDRLEARGLIERIADPSDRRVKMIAVTRAGAELRARLLDRISQPPPFIASLSESEQKTLRDILLKATRGAENG